MDDERGPANAVQPTFKGVLKPILWGCIALFALAVVKYVTGSYPATLKGLSDYVGDFKGHAYEHALVFCAGGLIEVLLSLRSAVRGLSARLPLLNRLADSSLLMKVARPLLERSAGIGTLAEKQRELACCLLQQCDQTMSEILNVSNWKAETPLFAEVVIDIKNLIPAPSQADRRIVSAYLMSLIDPVDWKRPQWHKYQQTLFDAQVKTAETVARVDFKRIHVLHVRDTRALAKWTNLVSLMIAEAIMGFRIKAMIVTQADVKYLVRNPNIGYTVDRVHLYDCGVYQGAQKGFVVLADVDPYFMSGRRNVDSSIVSEDVSLVDILRRNFNLAWRAEKSESLYKLLHLGGKKKLKYDVTNKNTRETLASFLPNHTLAPNLTDFQAALMIGETGTEAKFWPAFDAAIASIK